MNLYEVFVILNPSLSNDAVKGAVNKVEQLISKSSGKVEKTLNFGKKALGYEIKNKTNGIAYIVFFKLDPTGVKKLEKDLRLESDILKFTIFRASSVEMNVIGTKTETAPAGAR